PAKVWENVSSRGRAWLVQIALPSARCHQRSSSEYLVSPTTKTTSARARKATVPRIRRMLSFPVEEGSPFSNHSDPVSTRQTLNALLARRILVMDGAMGTMIQSYRLDEAGFRGE